VPLGPVPVNVYVVDDDGDTVLDPDVGKLVPILVIETLVTPEVVHDIVDDSGNIIDDGDAEIVAEGSGGQDPVVIPQCLPRELTSCISPLPPCVLSPPI
jgi:hypothetical protein